MSAGPWQRRTRRWGQTNLSELDPTTYDNAWWRAYWRRTLVQGVIVNAGGIVAYYPSAQPLHYRAAHLGARDLFGEIVADARAEGLAVLARMDSNRADERFYRAHPDWFVQDGEGRPAPSGDRYLACISGPYYQEYLPEVLREIIARYRPDGFTDNSWTGANRRVICHCAHCRASFGEATGLMLPTRVDWADPVYRQWVRWSYAQRTALWELNNRVTRAAGGPDCLWLGMVNGDPHTSHLSFCDLAEIGARAEMLMSDQQGRTDSGFEQNALSGALLHGVLGWDKLIPESMATYVRGEQAFRKAATPALEARHWMFSGIAGGISPWWHHIGAQQEDLRQFQTVEPVMRWHAANERYLYDREPLAEVGLVWSQVNNDFYGRDEAMARVRHPWRGWSYALLRARIPFLPVHADHIAGEGARRKLLILPDLAAMTEAQCATVRAFAARGGSVIATGKTSLLDEWGEPRGDLALGDLFGAQHLGGVLGVEGQPSSDWEVQSGHTYLRLPPEGERCPVLAAFAETTLVPFGGTLQRVSALGDVATLATYVPAFPIYPPEFSWMRTPVTDLPVLLARTLPGGGRCVYLPADVDRCYGRRGLPDHGDLLAALAHWALGEGLPLARLDGPGLVDVRLYRQEGRLLAHLVNLSGCTGWPPYLEQHLPVGPLRLTVRLPEGFMPTRALLRVADTHPQVSEPAGRSHATVEIPCLVDHELVVWE